MAFTDSWFPGGEHRKQVKEDEYKHLHGFQDSQIKTAVMKKKL